MRPDGGWADGIEGLDGSELERLGATRVSVGKARVGEGPLDATRTVILNACGTVEVGLSPSESVQHVAWQHCCTLFGWEDQAYTVAGNLSLQYRRVMFKGAHDPSLLVEVASQLLKGAATSVPRLRLGLVVMQTRLGKSLMVTKWCLLETRIREYAWAKDRDRIEELCNTALFGIKDWDLMLKEFGIKPLSLSPNSATVSVTRRGVMTVRITWPEPGMHWVDNEALRTVGDCLGRLVAGLV